MENGKTNDLAHMWNGEHVIFDLSRTQEGHFNYGVAESFKNGMICSPKYDGTSKVYAKPPIIVFANWEPDYKAWSADRCDVRKIDPTTKDFYVAGAVKKIFSLNDLMFILKCIILLIVVLCNHYFKKGMKIDVSSPDTV